MEWLSNKGLGLGVFKCELEDLCFENNMESHKIRTLGDKGVASRAQFCFRNSDINFKNPLRIPLDLEGRVLPY